METIEESVIIITQGSRYEKKITDKFLANNYKVVKATSEQEGERPDLLVIDTLLTELSWNYKSPFSSKNIILNLKSYPDIKNFFIVYSMPNDDTPVYKNSQIEMQKVIDLYIKSQLAITCELLSEFSNNNKSVNLFFILENSQNTPFKEFFKAFINTVLDDNSMTANINAFEIGKETPEVFADYVFSIVRDKKKARGKWFKQLRYTFFS